VNDYEIMLILDPALEESRANEIIARIRQGVEQGGGSWDGHEPWGRRKLAYEIGKDTEGVYHLLLFTTSPEALDEITRVLKITDGVTRHLAVRRVRDGHLKPPSPGLTGPVASATPAPEPETASAAEPEAASAPAPEAGAEEAEAGTDDAAGEPVAATAAAASAAADDGTEGAE
jgi:small subunit ribosomal protein S6